MTVPANIQRLLDSRQLETIEVSDADVAALWQKAVASARDAQNEGTSPDNQYCPGLSGAPADGDGNPRGGGYRTRGTQGHHANTYYAVAALGIDTLNDIDVRSERIRQMRKLSAYEPRSPTSEQISRLRELLAGSLPAARKWLSATRPHAVLVRPDRS